MNDNDWLAGRFEEHRPHLRSVAYRMLGSATEADDALQDAWLRLSRAGAGGVENMTGWLTTIVARVCLNMLQARRRRREESLEASSADGAATGSDLAYGPDHAAGADGSDPEAQALQADAVGLALLVVLDTLTPAERLAFVLHDMFAVPFDEIAPIVERSPAATRQLASRARRRVRNAAPPGPDEEQDADGPGAGPGGPESSGPRIPDQGTPREDTPQEAVDRERRRQVVRAFLAASREGDFTALLTLLDPDVVLRTDPAAAQLGGLGPAGLRGADTVAEAFVGRARGALPALIDGAAGAAWVHRGETRMVVQFTISGGRIQAIDLVSDPDHLARLDLEVRPARDPW